MSRVVKTTMADENHAVVTVVGEGGYQKTPCVQCPWRKVNAGSFPPQAFRISASTAYDMASNMFACHMRGKENPSTCAGFLLSESARDNMAVRLGYAKGEYADVQPCEDIFATYRKMAVANGVKPNEAVLRPCMPEARNRRNR